MPSIIGYWDTRGIGQPIRFLLEYVGEEYEDVRYVCGDAPDFDKSSWFDVKFTLGLDFPNIPYYIDGDIKITQSNTILRHLARKYKLYGDNAQEEAHVDLLLDVIMDLRNAFIKLCYGPDYSKETRAKYVEEAKGRIGALEEYLGSKKFFIGDKVTVCDFHIYEMLEQHRVYEESLLANRPILQAYMKRFEELPAIKKYMSSSRFKPRPINNKFAHFVGP